MILIYLKTFIYINISKVTQKVNRIRKKDLKTGDAEGSSGLKSGGGLSGTSGAPKEKYKIYDEEKAKAHLAGLEKPKEAANQKLSGKEKVKKFSKNAAGVAVKGLGIAGSMARFAGRATLASAGAISKGTDPLNAASGLENYAKGEGAKAKETYGKFKEGRKASTEDLKGLTANHKEETLDQAIFMSPEKTKEIGGQIGAERASLDGQKAEIQTRLNQARINMDSKAEQEAQKEIDSLEKFFNENTKKEKELKDIARNQEILDEMQALSEKGSKNWGEEDRALWDEKRGDVKDLFMGSETSDYGLKTLKSSMRNDPEMKRFLEKEIVGKQEAMKKKIEKEIADGAITKSTLKNLEKLKEKREISSRYRDHLLKKIDEFSKSKEKSKK